MKALTLHQPWATLIAAGIKTIETRSWSTKHRGPLAIHAAARRFGMSSPTADIIRDVFPMDVWRAIPRPNADAEMCDNYPLGAIIATCELVDVVPIRSDRAEITTITIPPQICVVGATAEHGKKLWHFDGTGNPSTEVTDQDPFGDFTPGRYAWILDDVKATDERCPACWGKGWHPRGQYGPGSTSEAAACLVCGFNPTRTSDPVPVSGFQLLWEWSPDA